MALAYFHDSRLRIRNPVSVKQPIHNPRQIAPKIRSPAVGLTSVVGEIEHASYLRICGWPAARNSPPSKSALARLPPVRNAATRFSPRKCSTWMGSGAGAPNMERTSSRRRKVEVIPSCPRNAALQNVHQPQLHQLTA